jgi:hypothetical protein
MEEKKVHLKITMETFGEEYQKLELLDCCCNLELVRKLQEKLAQALLSMNQR